MGTKKTGMKNNPLFKKTDGKVEKQEGMQTSKQENIQTGERDFSKTGLQRKTFYLEEDVFELLRKYAFENKEKMYRVVNAAIKDYIKVNS